MKNEDYYTVWHRALQLSDRSKWSADVERDFKDAQKLTEFEDWMQAYKHLFAQEIGEDDPAMSYWRIDSKEDFEAHWEPNEEDREGLKFICFNWFQTKDKLLKAFEQILREQHDGKRGRPKYFDNADYRRITGPVNVTASMKALDVWKAHDDNPKLSHSELAKKLGIGKRWNSDSANMRVLSATISRYIRTAQALIDGVEQGVFPNKP